MAKFSMQARKQSFYYAGKGIVKVFAVEHNMWIHLAITICVVAAGVFFHLTSGEWVMICFAIGMVIAAELFNSAIEKLVDMASPGFSAEAGLIKDISAGAVLVCAFTAAVIGLIIFVPYLLQN